METLTPSKAAPRVAPSKAPLARALHHLASLENPAGHWEAEMVWNSMLLSQYVLTRKMVDPRWPLPPETVRGILRHYEVTRRPDGSWGMHGESGGYVFMTTLAYVALRLLGLPADDPLVAPARALAARQRRRARRSPPGASCGWRCWASTAGRA